MAWTIAEVLLALFCFSRAVGAINPQHQHVIANTASHPPTSEDVARALKMAEIIPTVIDDFIPVLLLHAEWSSSSSSSSASSNITASLGNTLKPKKLQDRPSVSLRIPSQETSSSSSSSSSCLSGMNFVIALTDPDAPSRDDPRWSEFCHWIAVTKKSPGEANACGVGIADELDLEEVMEYKPPGPPKKTGKHRYVFLGFVPENGTTETLHLTKPSDRKHWGYKVEGDGKGVETKGVREWAAENGLVPVAANFIYAKNKKQ